MKLLAASIFTLAAAVVVVALVVLVSHHHHAHRCGNVFGDSCTQTSPFG